MKTGITVHMMVRNEEQWVWYAINSVLPYVKKLFIFDTGSIDQTVDIILSIRNKKITFEEKGSVTSEQLVALRNEQITRTDTSWFMLLDGDEVWPVVTIEELVKTAIYAKSKTAGVVVRTVVPLGDLIHYQPEEAGKYKLLGKTGQMNIRGYKKITGWRWQGIYPLETYIDKRGVPIQQNEQNLIKLQNPYWHLTHLRRSQKDIHGKRKFEFGVKRKIDLPEVFFMTRPRIVPTPWVSFTARERIQAQFVTPFLKIKRLIT